MDNQEKYGYLLALKTGMNLDVYYQINDKKFVEPVLINKCNIRNENNTGNIATKYYSVVRVLDKNIYGVYFFREKDEIVCVRNIEAKEAVYWMKQFYSSAMRLDRAEKENELLFTNFEAFMNSNQVFNELYRLKYHKEQLSLGYESI